MALRRRKRLLEVHFAELVERNYLFVCSQNKLRSPTAEHIFADIPGIHTLSAGTNRNAEEPLTDELVEWADYIFVMERMHRNKVRTKHRDALKDTRLVALGIPDDFVFMDPDLVRLLEQKMRAWLPASYFRSQSKTPPGQGGLAGRGPG